MGACTDGKDARRFMRQPAGRSCTPSSPEWSQARATRGPPATVKAKQLSQRFGPPTLAPRCLTMPPNPPPPAAQPMPLPPTPFPAVLVQPGGVRAQGGQPAGRKGDCGDAAERERARGHGGARAAEPSGRVSGVQRTIYI